MTLAVNPTASTFPTRQIYVAPWEFTNAPTGVDVNALVPGASVQVNQAALIMQLQRASQVADNLCQKVLAATLDTQHGRYRVQNDLMLGPVVKVPLDYTPVVAVSAVSWGWSPSTMTVMSSLANVEFSRKTATIPIYPPGATTAGPIVALSGSRALVNVTYVNGWANTALTATATTGATQISVATDLGIVPGQQLRLANANSSEVVTVSPSYVATANNTATTVPLVAPTVGSYAVGDLASALPQDIKQAIILIAKTLIKTRSSSSVQMPSAGTDHPGTEHQVSPGISDDYDLAVELLSPYRRSV